MTMFGDLPKAPKRFLFFTGINLISWQCIVGQVLVLFARALEMPSTWVGVLLSFMPISMLLVILSIPAVQTYGPKKLIITTWLIRNAIASAVFTIPLVTDPQNPHMAWYILLFATLGFSLARAFGVGAWYPWLHEIIPQKLMGNYFSTETIITQTLNIAITLLIAGLLDIMDGLNRYYWIYFIGISAGFISTIYVNRIPGGMDVSQKSSLTQKFSVITHALADRNYRRFLIYIMISMSAMMWITVSSILYFRDILGYSDHKIMYFLVLCALGVAFSVRFWANQAELKGTSPVMGKLMVLHAMAAILWFCLIPNTTWAYWLSLPVIAAGSVVNAGVAIVSSRGMMTQVRQEYRVGYTSLWIIALSIANGVPPLIAGWLINHYQLTGFQICFLVSALSGISIAFCWLLSPIEEREMPEKNLHHILKPSQPLRTLSRTVWLVLGFGRKKE